MNLPEDAEPLASMTYRTPDVVETARGQVVPIGYRTDGQWIWTDTVADHYGRTASRLTPSCSNTSGPTTSPFPP